MPYHPQALELLDELLAKMQAPFIYARRFTPELEEAFQLARLPRRIARYRETLWLGILLFSSFLITDFENHRQNFLECVLVRLGINVPIALLMIWVIPHAGRNVREFLFAFSAIPPAIGLLVLDNAKTGMLSNAQCGVTLLILFATTAMRPDFMYSVLSTSAFAAGYTGYLLSVTSLAPSTTHTYIALTWATVGLTLLSVYRAEVEERVAFLLRRRIEEQNASLGRINEELTRISLIDPLTGIPNRRAFNNEFRSAWDKAARRRQTLAVLMIDLDHFKSLNDRYGHDYGDRALITIARAMNDTLRAECDMLARYGGEEFIALLPNQSLASAQQIAQRLCETIRNTQLPGSPGQAAERASISIGVAAVEPGPRQRAAELLRAADVAVYQAKELGRNRIHPPLESAAGGM